MKHYRSSIPKAAQERVASTYESSGKRQNVEYVLDGEVVGLRWFREDGVIGTETPLKSGMIHGTHYYFDDHPKGILRVTFAWPHRNGLAHGTAKQWSDEDKLIGTFTMTRGTGWDLWRQDFQDGSIHLSEALHYKDGKWHGFEWWLEHDQKSVHQESHLRENLQHGIRREWDHEGKLKRGYPQYWVNNNRVTKRQYLRACDKDPNLPPFHEIDNSPQRNFPPEVQAAIKPSTSFRPAALS